MKENTISGIIKIKKQEKDREKLSVTIANEC